MEYRMIRVLRVVEEYRVEAATEDEAYDAEELDGTVRTLEREVGEVHVDQHDEDTSQ